MLLDCDLRSQQRVMPSHRALIPWPLARAERRVRAQSAARRGHGARYSPAHLPRAVREMRAAGMLGRAGTPPSGDFLRSLMPPRRLQMSGLELSRTMRFLCCDETSRACADR